MNRRMLLALGLMGCIAILVCSIGLRCRQSTQPWYFDAAQCETRLLGKTPAEVEAVVGSRPTYVGRARRDRPELDESQWEYGVFSRTVWHFPWGAVTVEYDEQDRSVTAEVLRYRPAWGETSRISVSRR